MYRHVVNYFDAGQLAISQYPEGPATGHLDTGFSWFPWAQERMLRWFPPFQVASTCFSCSPPDLNSVVTNCLLPYYVKQPLPPGDNPTAVNKYYYYILYMFRAPFSVYLHTKWSSIQSDIYHMSY